MSRSTLLSALVFGLSLLRSPHAFADQTELFDRLDTNDDNAITADEVEADKKRLFDRLIRTSDRNEDGKLQRDEFVAGTTPAKPTAGQIDARPAPGSRAGLNPGVIFQRMDRNKDGKISGDEMPDRMREGLARVDENGDGAVDREEFEKIAQRMRLAATNPRYAQFQRTFMELDKNKDRKLTLDEVPGDRKERFSKMLEKLDDDGDGAIELPQFIQAMMKIQGQSVANQPQARNRQPQVGGGFAVFRALDKNRDGKLSKDEVDGATESLRKLDRNGNGSVEPQELAVNNAGRPGQRPSAGFAEQMLKRINAADRNSDGKISRDEAPERLANMFDRMDSNSDGYLDESEVKSMVARMSKFNPQGGQRRNNKRPRRPAAERE